MLRICTTDLMICLLKQNLERFRLLDDVKKILLGCVNGWDLLRPQVKSGHLFLFA